MNCEKCKYGIFCPTWGMWKCFEKIRFVFPHELSSKCDKYVAKGKGFEEKECHCEDCLRTKGTESGSDE